MTNSLGKQLTYRIMAVVLVMMAVIACIVYYMVREYMLEEAQERYEGVLLRDHEEFRRRLSDVMVATNNHLYDIEQEVDEPEKIMPHLERILQVNPTILSTGILYSPDYFPGKPRCLELFASRDSAGVIHLGRIENDHNVNIDRAWYKKGMEQDTADWSEVYFENDLIPNVTGRRQLTTYAVPVHKDGRPVAIFGSDLPLEYLRSQLMDDLQAMHEKYERGCKTHSFSFVVDRDGTYIMHPDEERLLSGNFFEEVKHTSAKIDDDVLMSMINGENGSAMVERSLLPLFDCKDSDIVIDCSDLNYISSSGLRIMLNIYKHARANGHDAILKAMNEEVEEVFSLSGFLQLFKKES